MESILHVVSTQPVDLTYLGIGSCPHPLEGQKLDPSVDQLIPVCFHEIIFRDKRHIRIIHIDPAFDQTKEFLKAYFEEIHLIPVEFPGGMSWISEMLEVYVISESIDHTDQYWFFESLCDMILNTNGKLVVQEYTGCELQSLNRQLYAASEQKDKFKCRILFDMTYGTDTGCCTDMTKAQPFYDYNGEFLNFHFATDSDVKRWVGISLKVDELLRKKYRSTYRLILNRIHVDYRRKCKGDSVMYGSPHYSSGSSPDEIMNVLQTNLRSSIDILVALRVIDVEKQRQIEELFLNYKKYDMYTWYDSMTKIV